MPRFLSFMIFVFLQLTIVLAKSILSMVLNVCYTIENLFQLNSAFKDNAAEFSNTEKNATAEILNDTCVQGVTVSTQTVLANAFPECMYKKNSDTDILIYNLNSASKITVTHTNLERNCIKSNYCSYCERFKPEVNKLNGTDSQNENPSFKTGDTFSVTKSEFSQSMNSNSSNMSIEKDSTNSQIILNSQIVFPNSKLLNEELINKSTQHFSCDYQNDDNCIPKFEDCDEQENDENMPPRETSMEDRKEETVQHQTSSPIDIWLKRPTADQHAEFNIAFHNHENVMEADEIETQSTKNIDKLHSTIDDQFNKRISILENTILLDESVRQRLSLSPSTKSSATKAAALSLKSIQDEIIEHARKTPRYEVNIKDIKFPYTPEFKDLFQTMDDKEENKEIFSCSSYESLPFSDHIRTAFEKSLLCSLYTENFANVTEPDFSSVDSLVEAFRKFESTFSIYEPATNKMSEGFAPSKNGKNKFGRNLSVEFLEIDKRQSQPNMRKALSSGMLYNTSNHQHSHKKDKLDRNYTDSEYQNCIQYLSPLKSTNFKSRTSSLSSIPSAEVSANEVKESEYNYKTEISESEYENTLYKTTIYSNDTDTNLETDFVHLNNHTKTSENNTGTEECNRSNSDSDQFEEIQNVPEHNQENNTLPGKSAKKIETNSQAKPEPVGTKNVKLTSSKQSIGENNIHKIKSPTGSRNKTDQQTTTLLKSKCPHINILSDGYIKLENSKICSLVTDSDAFEELQRSGKIEEKECSEMDEILVDMEKSANSLELNDTPNIQSMMNNDIDKYKFTFIED